MGAEGKSLSDGTVALAQRVIDLTTGVIGTIAPDQLGNSTPCAEWVVSAVLDHITNGAAMYASSVAPGSVPDELMTQIKGGADYQGCWATATTLAMAAAAQPGALEKTVTLPFGEMTAGAFLGYVIFDLTTHATDLARATGQTIAGTELLEAALEAGHRTVGPQLRQPGVFDPNSPYRPTCRSSTASRPLPVAGFEQPMCPPATHVSPAVPLRQQQAGWGLGGRRGRGSRS